jgi:hypothetical protein
MRRALTSISMAAAASGLACYEDKWPIQGYARIEGAFTQTSPGTMDNSIFIACGPGSPITYSFMTAFEPSGRYALDLDVPGPAPLPDNGELVCRVAIPGNSPPVGSAQATVPFSRDRSTRPAVTSDVGEGVFVRLPLP